MIGQRGPRQLVLALDHVVSFARENFLIGPSNEAAVTLVEAWPDWPDRVLALVGPEGSGKSHLAAIWASEAGARFLSGRSLESGRLPGALATGALVVDDLAEGRFDEAALFHLLNLVREEQAYLLLTAPTPPAGWRVGTRDLASRLKALPVASLAAADDALFRAVLVKQFADRQLSVGEDLIGYLATHLERSFAAARDAVVRLDEEAMRLRRPLTRALAADVLRHGEP